MNRLPDRFCCLLLLSSGEVRDYYFGNVFGVLIICTMMPYYTSSHSNANCECVQKIIIPRILLRVKKFRR